MNKIPILPGRVRKNDALFMYGASRPEPFVFVYRQQEVEVVHGPSCRPACEVHVDQCRQDGVAVVERRGGGGTVVLSPGMLVTVIVAPRKAEDGPLDIFRKLHEVFIGVFDDAGFGGVTLRGISDLAVRDKKILGSSLYLGTRPFLYYYQSSLMVSSDPGLLDRYLLHPPKEPDYRRGRNHGQFCSTLTQQGCNLREEDLLLSLTSALKYHLR